MNHGPIKNAPPSRCVSLAELVAHEHGTWTADEAKVGDAHTDYALPVNATDEVLAYLRPLAAVEIALGGTARIPAGRVIGAGAVLSADGTLLARDVSGDLGNATAHHWLIGYAGLRAPKSVDGSVAVVAVNLGEGYAHWLLEELPRLLTVPLGETEHLVVHADAAYARQALAMRGGQERVIAAKRRLHLRCAPLVVPRLAAGPGAPSRRALDLIEAFTAQLGRGLPGFGERLYFTREKAGRRRVANEAALWAKLDGLGFAKIALEELSWAEQIAACRRARVVVAPHGAGLANLAFCAPGTRVVELVNRRYFNPGYWRLAALQGLDYRVVMPDGEGPRGEDRSANRDDITADLGRVSAALQ
jgi:capsular polysaccharide biosynthesis protein